MIKYEHEISKDLAILSPIDLFHNKYGMMYDKSVDYPCKSDAIEYALYQMLISTLVQKQ